VVASNVPHPLERNKSQREIHRLTGIDRKTIRRYEQLYRAQAAEASNSSGVATGSRSGAREFSTTGTSAPP